ncbi:MAG: HAMP domain-containing histidine kinase [Bacteroidetes bacterium]|nr:HAMP domain-containing histidine kinase [Bacteroidota bacterium]
MKKVTNKYQIHFYLISAICLLIAFYLMQYGVGKYHAETALKSRFEENLIERQLKLETTSHRILEILRNDPISNWPSLERLLNPEGINAQLFMEDSLIFWNSNHIKNQLADVSVAKLDTIIKEKTGWYLLHMEQTNDFKIFLFELIKSEYPFQNKFLPSIANAVFISTNNIQLTNSLNDAQYVISGQNGSPLIGLIFIEDGDYSQQFLLWLFLVFVSAYIFIILWISSLYKRFSFIIPNKKYAFIIFIADLVLLRLADFYFYYPAVLKQSFLFEPQFDIMVGMNSVGDLVLTTIILISILFRFNKWVKREKTPPDSKNKYLKHALAMGLMWIVTISSFYIICRMIGILKINPALGIQLTGYKDVLPVLVILLTNVVLFLMVRAINYYSLNRQISLVYKILFVSMLAILSLLFMMDNPVIVIGSLGYILLLISIFSFVKDTLNVKFLKYLLYLIIFAAANALVINESVHKEKDTNQEKTAHYLAQKKDINLEKTFSEFTTNIKADTVLHLILENYSDDPEFAINEYLKARYFKKISGKYDIQLTLCSEDELLEIQPEGILIGCDAYFNGLIQDYGDSTGISNLYLQNSTPESIYYIGLIENDMMRMMDDEINMYLEFFFTYVPEGLGYPELLVDNKTLAYDLSGYAFAKYSNDKLVYKFGDFAYYTDYSSIREFPAGEFYNYSEYRHFKLTTTGGDTLIISRPVVTVSEQMATFSIMLLLLGMIALIVFLTFFSRQALSYFTMSFRTRLQVFFIGTISATILIIAIITTYYAENSNKERLITQLNEKTYSVLIELQHKLGTINSFDEFPVDELQPLLRKFSLVFFSDINVYDASGKLVASSRPEIFKKGLLSERISPLAFEEINVDKKLFYTAEEKIGELAYYSSYVPLNLGDNEPIGIVNLPYFARQTEVKKSYYLMIFSFLNLFVVAGILGTFIALLISKLLTKPLVVLQQSLSEIRIDEQNERIEWMADDEIGMLIKEYNQMVDKLEQSAELLKHSERESAWREVARQIAHEIKNPLTPMKLNIQYLEKAYNEDDPALQDKVITISKSLIQQIDTLDKVAEMFSDFAKSNIRKMDEVELLGVIKSTVALFKNYEHITFRIIHDENEYYTKAIEKDLIRLFNNLIKNAVQSLDNTADAKIEISITHSVSYIEVKIADNGKGIDEAFKNKVFQPYFTTKSGGTGLGLAIVKNIINETGGNISFESSKNGTVFYLQFNRSDALK